MPNDNWDAVKGRIDWDFMHEVEGDWSTGYVPNPAKKHHSGVTIVNGYDLGEKTEDDFKRMGLSEGLRQKLRPYMGKAGPQGSEAIKALNTNLNQFRDHLNTMAKLNSTAGRKIGPTDTRPVIGNASRVIRDTKPGERPTHFVSRGLGLELTPAEAEELRKAVRIDYYQKVTHKFDVVASRSKRPHFSTLNKDTQTGLFSLNFQGALREGLLKAAAAGNWPDVVDTLKATPFDDAYYSRRRAEGLRIGRGNGIAPDHIGPKQEAYNSRVMGKFEKSLGTLGNLNSKK